LSAVTALMICWVKYFPHFALENSVTDCNQWVLFFSGRLR
jgi:hypothetical protein